MKVPLVNFILLIIPKVYDIKSPQIRLFGRFESRGPNGKNFLIMNSVAEYWAADLMIYPLK